MSNSDYLDALRNLLPTSQNDDDGALIWDAVRQTTVPKNKVNPKPGGITPVTTTGTVLPGGAVPQGAGTQNSAKYGAVSPGTALPQGAGTQASANPWAIFKTPYACLTWREIDEKLSQFFPQAFIVFDLSAYGFNVDFSPNEPYCQFVSYDDANNFIMNSATDEEALRKFREFFGLEVPPLPDHRDKSVCWKHEWVEVTLFHTAHERCKYCDIKRSEVKE